MTNLWIRQTSQPYKIKGNTSNNILCFKAYTTFHLTFCCLVPAKEITILVLFYHLPTLQLTIIAIHLFFPSTISLWNNLVHLSTSFYYFIGHSEALSLQMFLLCTHAILSIEWYRVHTLIRLHYYYAFQIG